MRDPERASITMRDLVIRYARIKKEEKRLRLEPMYVNVARQAWACITVLEMGRTTVVYAPLP